MTFAEYKQAVGDLPYGKRLPQAVYVFTDAATPVPEPLGTLLARLRERFAPAGGHNLVKLHTESFKISLLNYPRFMTDPHPALEEAVVIDLAAGKAKVISYSGKDSPPILHRKETMIPPEHPKHRLFASLTREEEQLGLLQDTSRIGFKLNWGNLLRSKGISYQGHRIKVDASPAAETKPSVTPVEVQRHRTAMTRSGLSKPIRDLLSLGLLPAGASVFDYGCGHGSDVRLLREMGFTSHGWDPAFSSDEPKRKAAVVNLGFVLNVIEDPAERVDTLLETWALTEGLLVVSSLVEGQENYQGFNRQLNDGILTGRSTFQKYFAQAELQHFIEETLHADADAISLGTFLVFRNPQERQAFLFSRIQRELSSVTVHRRIFRPDGPSRRRLRFDEIYAQHAELLDAFWQQLIQLARAPLPDEFNRHAEIVEKIGKVAKVSQMLLAQWGEEELAAARTRRTDDLLVYLALAQFRKAVPLGHLPEIVRRDIKNLMGSYQPAKNAARELLFSTGDVGVIEEACNLLPFGWKTDDHLIINRSPLDRLPPVLRLYVHCSSIIYGDPRDADLIKIHKRSGKVTLQFYDDFEGKPLPQLKLRVKVNLRSLRAQIFDHSERPFRQLMPFKERFLGADHPQMDEFRRFSKKLRLLGLTPEATSNGVAPDVIADALERLKR